MYMKLADRNPIVEKIRRLEECAENLGLRLEAGDGGQILVFHKDDARIFYYVDVEHRATDIFSTSVFPLGLETKIIYEKEDIECEQD